MINFWLAMTISLVLAIVYIGFSVFADMKQLSQNKENSTFNGQLSKKYLVLPLLFILAVPLAYYHWGNSEKQANWLIANQNFSEIQSGVDISLDTIEVKNLLLALRTSIDNEPKNGQLWFLLAESYFQLGNVDLANLAIKKAIKIESNPQWLVANAQILSARSTESDLKESTQLLRTALMIQPNHQSALLTLGFVYFRQHQYQQSLDVWQRLKLLLEKSGNKTEVLIKQIDYVKQLIKDAPQSN